MNNKLQYVRDDETVDDLQLKGLNLIQRRRDLNLV